LVEIFHLIGINNPSSSLWAINPQVGSAGLGEGFADDAASLEPGAVSKSYENSQNFGDAMELCFCNILRPRGKVG
jgi:hypothetical protein